MKHLLKNGNMPYDLRNHPLCGANKRKGGVCKGKAMKNGRCRIHGGKSTGARTEEGKQKLSTANLKTGLFTKELFQIKKTIRMARLNSVTI